MAIFVPGSSLTSLPCSEIQASFPSGSSEKSGTRRRASRTGDGCTSDLPQVLVDELDGDRAFPDGGGAPFYRAVSHVPGDEDAGDAGLQEKGITVQSPAFGTFPVSRQVGAGEYEAPLVATNDAGQPVGVGGGTYEDEERVRRDGLCLP